MTLNEILSDPKSQRSLALFDGAAVRTVEKLLVEKNGKPYLKCQVRNSCSIGQAFADRQKTEPLNP